MKDIFYAGNDRIPCAATYEIKLSSDMPPIATIVVRQSSNGTVLTNADEGRDSLLNRILANDLAGVRLDFVKFVVVGSQAYEYDIHLDVDDYVQRGNPIEGSAAAGKSIGARLLSLIGKGDRNYEFFSYHVVGGCARFYTRSSEERPVPMP